MLKATGVLALIVWVGASSLLYYVEPHSDIDDDKVNLDLAAGGEEPAVFTSIVDAMYYCTIFLAGEWCKVTSRPSAPSFAQSLYYRSRLLHPCRCPLRRLPRYDGRALWSQERLKTSTNAVHNCLLSFAPNKQALPHTDPSSLTPRTMPYGFGRSFGVSLWCSQMADFEELEDESVRIQYLWDRGIQIGSPVIIKLEELDKEECPRDCGAHSLR